MNEKSVREAIRDTILEMLVFMISTLNAALGFFVFIYGLDILKTLGAIIFAISIIASLLLLKLIADNVVVFIKTP